VLTGRKEKAALAAQVAAVGHIVNGTAEIELGNFLIPLVPMVIQQGTDSFHNGKFY
jgi:hypothetical protein